MKTRVGERLATKDNRLNDHRSNHVSKSVFLYIASFGHVVMWELLPVDHLAKVPRYIGGEVGRVEELLEDC